MLLGRKRLFGAAGALVMLGTIVTPMGAFAASPACKHNASCQITKAHDAASNASAQEAVLLALRGTYRGTHNRVSAIIKGLGHIEIDLARAQAAIASGNDAKAIANLDKILAIQARDHRLQHEFRQNLEKHGYTPGYAVAEELTQIHDATQQALADLGG